MNSVRKSLVYATSDRYFALAVNFSLLAVISRLLTPSEIGISVTGSAVVGVAVSLREFASTAFLIQRVNLSNEDVRAAFTVLLTLTFLISGSLCILAPLIANAYGQDGLAQYLFIIAAGILAEVVAAPAVALMRRDMAFGHVALVNVVTTATSAGATITLAILGFSYMSFAWAWLVSAVLGSVLALSLRRQFWILKPVFSNWGDVLAFGSYNGLNAMLARMYDQVPYLILGRVVSFDASALFNRTLAVAQLPDRLFVGGVLSVVFPAFSSEFRSGRDLKKAYLNALTFVTAVHWPALTLVAMLAHPAVMFLYGDQWLQIVPLVRIAAIASLFSFSFGLNYAVLVSVGAIHEAFLRSLIVWPVSALMLVATAPFGLQYMALSLLVAIPFQAFISLLFVRRHIRMSWWDFVLSLWKSGAATIGSAVGPAAIAVAYGPSEIGPVAAIAAGGLSGLGWLVAIWLVRHPVVHEIGHVAGFFGRLFRRTAKPTRVLPPLPQVAGRQPLEGTATK